MTQNEIDNKELNHNFTVDCGLCERAYEVFMDYDDYQSLLTGTPIEQAMPYMPKEMQKLLIYRIGPCCDKVTPPVRPVVIPVKPVQAPQQTSQKTRVLTTKKGVTVVTPLTDTEAFGLLIKLKGEGKLSDFGKDLCAKMKKLSADQVTWVHKIVLEATQPKAQAKPQLNLGNMKRVIEMFENAKQHLKWPKIRLEINGTGIVLSLAGPTSKYPGAINVKTFSKDLGTGDWLGRINTNGDWVPSKVRLPGTEDLLRLFAEDPLSVAAAYGKLTGNCCFCNRTLTDDRSTEVGYGPVCAKHFGLVWGN